MHILYFSCSVFQVSSDAVNRSFTALILCEKGNEEGEGEGKDNAAFVHLHNTALFVPEGRSMVFRGRCSFCDTGGDLI